jgi:hypothetical protein
MDTLASAIHSGPSFSRGEQLFTIFQGPFFAFAAVVAGVAAWSIWGQDLFPSQDPTGGMFLNSPILEFANNVEQTQRRGHTINA